MPTAAKDPAARLISSSQVQQPRSRRGFSTQVITTLLASSLLLLVGCSKEGGDSLATRAEHKAIETMGGVALKRMREGGHGGFHDIPVQVKEITDGVLQVQGIANTHAIQTNEGYVLFDVGLVIQAVQQRDLLKPKLQGPLSHIILSHSHADHVGGYRIWKEEHTQTIAHREFAEEQRYLTELDTYLHNRNRVMFSWMPEKPAKLRGAMNFRGIEADISVGEKDYAFSQGGVDFLVLSTPGAEGADNISLWLPQKKVLFTGDTLGPNFPQFPNIFTARGEKVRKPIEYIQSLNKMIALDAEILVPSHRDHIVGKDKIREGLTRIRDATQYVHDAVIDGMNAGKTVYQLMEEISLPAELALTQEHGRVSWAVKSIWEYYATWFHFDSPTELFHVPVREVYGDIAELAGNEALIQRAEHYIAQGDALKALHLMEMLLTKDADHQGALNISRQALLQRREIAKNITGNTYEYDVLSMYLKRIEAKLAE